MKKPSRRTIFDERRENIYAPDAFVSLKSGGNGMAKHRCIIISPVTIDLFAMITVISVRILVFPNSRVGGMVCTNPQRKIQNIVWPDTAVSPLGGERKVMGLFENEVEVFPSGRESKGMRKIRCEESGFSNAVFGSHHPNFFLIPTSHLTLGMITHYPLHPKTLPHTLVPFNLRSRGRGIVGWRTRHPE